MLSFINTGDNLAGHTLVHLPHLKQFSSSPNSHLLSARTQFKLQDTIKSSISTFVPIIGPLAIKITFLASIPNSFNISLTGVPIFTKTFLGFLTQSPDRSEEHTSELQS